MFREMMEAAVQSAPSPTPAAKSGLLHDMSFDRWIVLMSCVQVDFCLALWPAALCALPAWVLRSNCDAMYDSY